MINEAYKYKGRNAKEVADELSVSIDFLLDELNDSGYYCCCKCGRIFDVEQLGNDLDNPCDDCRVKKWELYELTSGCAISDPWEAETKEEALESILEERGEGVREVTDE